MDMTDEELIAAIKETDRSQCKPLVEALVDHFGGDLVQITAMIAALRGTQSANPFNEGLISASEMPPAQPVNPLWFGIYPGRVSLLIGETGAGKSSLLLNVAVYAALGEFLWNFGFPGSQRVLYVDPENSGSYRDGEREGGLCGMKLDRIGKGKPENLDFHDGRGVNLSETRHMTALRDLICDKAYKIVILDPIANLFDTLDENSNSEAARQGKALTALSRETGAAIIVAHHTGKDTTGNYGRGASARLGAADVGLVFRARGSVSETDDSYTGDTRQRMDVCRLQIVKDRPNWFGPSSRYLRMAGDDRFDLDTFESWSGVSKPARATKQEQAEEEIIALMQDEKERSRQEVQTAMTAEGYGEAATDSALKALAERKALIKRTGERNTAYYQIARETGEI